jgi:predicted nucleic acid-binding protein
MIFLDANFIIAYSVKGHKNYNRAIEIWETIEDKDKIISKLIIAEILNVLNTRLKTNIELIEKVCKFIANELIILQDEQYYIKGLKLLKEYYPKRIQFTDCVYMALMEDLEIKEIITFDRHFDLNKKIKRIY